MPEEFNIEKLKKENPEFFELFSSELLEFIFSEETSSKIAEICSENEVKEKGEIEKIAYRVTLALLNQVPKENLAEILEKGVNLDNKIAEKISNTIEKRIFSQIPEVQPEEIQTRKIQKEEGEEQKGQIEEDKTEKSKLIQPIESLSSTTGKEKPEKPPQKDTYREPIE